MIEVEKKVLVTPELEKRIIESSEFLHRKEIKDVYFDTPDWSLSCKDHWLRERDGKWELQQAAHAIGMRKCEVDQYVEIEGEQAVREELQLPDGAFLQVLKGLGYQPFAILVTDRRTYKNGDFTIVLDSIDFGYTLGEIELMVNTEEEKGGAVDRIVSFAKEFGFETTPVRGKLLEYIYRTRPEHWNALVDAGLI